MTISWTTLDLVLLNPLKILELKYLQNVVKKCNRKLGLIMRTVDFNAPVNVTKALYLALIRSDLEFGSCLWSGTSRHNVECLEGVQRRVTKFIMRYPDLDYRECLCQLNLLPLTLRRVQLNPPLFFKCITGAYDLDIDKYVKFCNSGSGQGHPTTRSSTDPLLLKVPFCRTEAFKSSFFNRIVSLWNQLPPNTRSSVSFLFLFLKLMQFFFLNQNLILILKPTVLAHGFLHVAALCAAVLGGRVRVAYFWSRWF